MAPKNKAFTDPRGDQVAIKTGKYAGLPAWKDMVRGETPKQQYVVVEVPKYGYVTGIRVHKKSIGKVTEIKSYEDFLLKDPTVYKAFCLAAKAIAKCDITATDYILKQFKKEVDKAPEQAAVRGDWYGNIRDNKATYPLASMTMNTEG